MDADDSEDPYVSDDGVLDLEEDGVLQVAMGNAPEHPAALSNRVTYSSSASVNNSSEDEDREEAPATFDAALTSEHSYLGSDLEVLSGRTLLDDGSYKDLELLPPTGVVLVPGQTLPLTVFETFTINMLRQCILNDRTFGVLANWYFVDGTPKINNNVGTTAEIYEYQAEGGQSGFRVKAKARQRFKVISTRQHSSGLTAKVKILPEVRLPDALNAVRFASLNRHRTNHPFRCRLRDAVVTRWPEWVYRQYETDRLVKRIKKELMFLEQGQHATGRKICIPDDPTELSFWVVQNLPMTEDQRLFILKLNSPIQRLRWELSALQQCQILSCHHCLNEVGSCRDVFSMSAEGPQGTYVNPGGYLHETLTLYKVKRITTSGSPSTEFSWFPGYAWTIAKCMYCHRHIGWKFTATKKSLKPSKFWGLCRRSLSIHLGLQKDDERLNLVM